jgi:type VI secretion system protein ImpE
MTAVARALEACDLTAAREAASADVKARPRSADARMLLAELCVLSGDLDRAETHARLAATAEPRRATALSVFRQHLRGLHARAAWWEKGAVPDLPGGPTELDGHALALNVALREGDGAAAGAALRALEEVRGARPGLWNGVPTDDLRDLDDRLPHALEAVTSGGRYLWLGLDRIAGVTFVPPARPLDLALRRARVTLHVGSEADVLVCAVAPGAATDAERLARTTEFEERPGGIVATRGQKALLVGEEMRGLLEAETMGALEPAGAGNG